MIWKLYNKLEEAILIALMLLSTAVVCYSVVMRYVVKDPVLWSEELTCYFQVWIAYIGISYVARDLNDFIRFDFLLHRMKPKARKAMLFIENAIMIAFMTLMVVVSTKWIVQIYSFGGISTPMKVPNYIPRAVIPVSFLLMLIHYINSTVKEIRNLCGTAGGEVE